MDVLKYLTNCKIFSTVTQDEDENAWLRARTNGIGGSDIGAICGVSKFSSATQVYLSKTGQYEEGLKPNAAASERMHFGHVLEPVVADEYVRQTGYKVEVIPATLVHKDYPWALANIDRLIVDDDGKPIGILECKTTSEYGNSDWEAGELPLSYIYQLNWYLWVLGLERGAFACLVGGNKFYHYDVFRNDELLNDIMIPAAIHFWNENVLKMVEPELQGVDSEYINSKYTEVEKNSEIVLDSSTDNDLALSIIEYKAKIKELENAVEEAQNRIKDKMQNNEIAHTQDCIITWSPRSQTRVDTNKLKSEFPEIYEQVKTQNSFRVMKVKGAF